MLLDNKKNGKVGEVLKENLQSGSRLSIISGLFSIYGFEALKKELLNVETVRLLFSKIQLEKDGVSTANFNGLNGDNFERRFQNRLTQSHIAKECSEWLSKKVEIKATTNPHILNQNLFHIENVKDEIVAIQGSSNFTSSGLGYSESDNYDMNTCSSDSNSTKELLGWFDSIWNNPDAVYETKELLLSHLDTIIKDNSPEFIYFLTLFNIFKDFLEELDEENIIKIKTGFKDTLIWNKLYKFQKDGVLGAIEKLEKYNGCIIADSVGLGKTFEALAVIKYYELRNDRILVLCPKRLRENWTIYTVNDKLNTLAGDRFNFDVLNHTDLTRVQGKSGEINLETLNWGNYDLIVIEESHNFRNNNSRKDGFTRYSRLMDDIIKSGVKTKVLMLSATPVNNRMNDLKNQVAFITEGIDDTFVDLGISSIEQTLKKAQTRFNQWLDLDEQERQLDILLEKMSFDYFKLLDVLTIARSRKHIEKYYDIAEIGKFPERLKPINIKEDIDLEGKFPPLSDINKTIRRLNLSAYSPLKYVKMEKREEYNRKYDIQVKDGSSVFKQVDREQSLIHLMRVNLLKRMESSINSFALTLEKLLYEINNLITRIDAHGEESIEELSIEDIEIDSPEFEAVLIGKKVKVLINDIDAIRWKQDLEDDHQKLTSLLNEARSIDSSRDAKLNKLKTIIEHKCNAPINPDNKKVLVFTAFADTAHYIYENIAEWAQTDLGIYSSVITGSRPVKTTMPGIKQNLSNLIISFSPRSKEREKIDSSITDEIDILIATDCLSEGQNLQDCDYLVNYDIHWNPVRIIQRFGRIDRLGSQNDYVQLLNFWPNMELDEYINLEARVSGRMILLDISATGEENIIEYDEKKKMNDLEYRRKQLQHLQENVVDIEEMSGGVSITDLTLNDFRMDLSQYIKEQSDNFKTSPTGLYAVISNDKTISDSEIEPGVIFCLKNVSSKIKTESSYAIAPYYLVYVTDNGSVKYNFMQTKKILDLLKKLSLGLHNPDDGAIELFNKFTNNAKDMSHYCSLLESAINSIIGKTEEKGVESLFSRGGTVLSKDTFQGIEDFEVISYLILK
jgi:SNF2 family DNA or RNA helicase